MFRDKIDYDLELEEKVLGIFLDDSLAYATVMNVLREDFFYGHINRELYKAIHSVYAQGYGIDYLTVQRYFYDKGILDIQGEKIMYIIATRMMGVNSSAYLIHWAIMIRDLAAKRIMYEFKNSGSLNGDTFEEASKIQDKLSDIMSVKSIDDWVHISQVGVKLAKHMDYVEANGIAGIKSSIPILDDANGGFRNTNLVVIGARPSVGKSAFMGRIATRAAADGKVVGIISLEMEDKDILARSVSADSDVDFWRIDRMKFEQEDEQREKVYQAMGKLSKLPIYYSDTAQVNLMDIRAKCERLKAQHGCDILIIDYLQLIESEISSNFRNREQEVSKIVRGLKVLAMNMKIVIIILAQLNRQSAESANKKPELHHLRESGSIEQDADVVMFLHRDWVAGVKEDIEGKSTEYQADLLIRKWRNGSTLDIKMGFDGPKMKFYDLPTPGQVFKQDKPNAGFENRGRLPESTDDTPF